MFMFLLTVKNSSYDVRRVFKGKKRPHNALMGFVKKNSTHELQKQPLTEIFQNGVFKNFSNFTGKHLCWVFFSKVCNFIKKRRQRRCERYEIVKNVLINRTPLAAAFGLIIMNEAWYKTESKKNLKGKCRWIQTESC